MIRRPTDCHLGDETATTTTALRSRASRLLFDLRGAVAAESAQDATTYETYRSTYGAAAGRDPGALASLAASSRRIRRG